MFMFGKKKKPTTKSMLRAQPGVQQKRSAFRMPVEFEVFYELDGRKGRRSALANDLSAGGLRLVTDEDLIKGSLLHLDIQLPADFLEEMTVEKEVFKQTPFGLRPETVRERPPGFEPMRLRSKALAPFYDIAMKKFAYGMAFVDTPPPVQEELQRFIHLWQLNFLRTRRNDD